MRILIVAMAGSSHTARWLAQLKGQPWDIHLFPVDNSAPHPDLADITVHAPDGALARGDVDRISVADQFWPFVGRGWPFSRGSYSASRILARLMPSWNDRVWHLAKTILKLQPALVHSLEIQRAGYMTYGARQFFVKPFPRWIVTNWGSDIHLFGRLKEHEPRIRQVLETCDFYTCECQRDVPLARALGLRGQAIAVLPGSGGLDLAKAATLRSPGPTSARRLIMVKGYQHWAGRALTALRALERNASLLSGYEIAIYSASGDVPLAARLLAESTGLKVTLIPYCSQEEILTLHGRARISIGASISDGISTSMLEALVMGSFPIQSHTACADEWLKHGQTGFLVHPEDSDDIANALRMALLDDALVDGAADLNARVAAERLDAARIRRAAVQMYEEAAANRLSGDGRQVSLQAIRVSGRRQLP